jgi:MinD-like ATPase involved in chromosome partitioning or flagellar assembly
VLTYSHSNVTEPGLHAVEHASRGMVIAVTSARQGTAKRGLSTALAMALVHAGCGDTCLVDIDIAESDVAKRFAVRGSTVVDLARQLRDEPHLDTMVGIARDEGSGCFVVPTAEHRLPFDADSYVDVLTALRKSVDCVVVDAPVALGTGTRPLDRIAPLIDVLVVATLADISHLSAATTYLSAISRGRAAGLLPTSLRAHVVVTGAAYTRPAERIALQRNLRVAPDAALLPQLWGRDAVAPVVDGQLTAPFAHLLEQLGFPATVG